VENSGRGSSPTIRACLKVPAYSIDGGGRANLRPGPLLCWLVDSERIVQGEGPRKANGNSRIPHSRSRRKGCQEKREWEQAKRGLAPRDAASVPRAARREHSGGLSTGGAFWHLPTSETLLITGVFGYIPDTRYLPCKAKKVNAGSFSVSWQLKNKTLTSCWSSPPLLSVCCPKKRNVSATQRRPMRGLRTARLKSGITNRGENGPGRNVKHAALISRLCRFHKLLD